jgi:hypothetical protein
MKTVKKKNILEPLRIKTVQAPVKKGDIPLIHIENDYPTRYNEASAILKDAEQLMKDLKPIMLPDALAVLYQHNSNKPWDPIASVKLQDDSGEATRITFSSAYNTTTVVAVELLFGQIKKKDGQKPDINTYLTRTMKAKFDDKVFLTPEGRFDQDKYEQIVMSLGLVCQDLGIPNPLSVEETVVPLPDFHSRRWMDFDADTNARITEVMPNTISFTPLPVKKKDQEEA